MCGLVSAFSPIRLASINSENRSFWTIDVMIGFGRTCRGDLVLVRQHGRGFLGQVVVGLPSDRLGGAAKQVVTNRIGTATKSPRLPRDCHPRMVPERHLLVAPWHQSVLNCEDVLLVRSDALVERCIWIIWPIEEFGHCHQVR
jgi:hypothetical protein